MTREEFINWFEERFVLNKNNIYEFGQLYDEVTKPQWISVEDELPPVNEAFIAYWNNFVIVQQGRDERFGNNKHITHWMPLPQPPKKGGAL